MKHRRPPLPHWKALKGTCRWCGDPVLKPDGSASVRRWHPACVTAYKIAAWPAEARKAVWVKNGGVCQGCGLDLAAEALKISQDRYGEHHRNIGDLRTTMPSWAPKWQCDHIVELVDSDRNPAHWSVANMQVLCCACHAAKSAASRRARSQKANPVPKPPDTEQKELW